MILASSRCLEYKARGHPESPQRVKAASDYLKKKGFRLEEAQACSEEDLLLVHKG